MGRTPKDGIARKKRSYRLVDADHQLLLKVAAAYGVSVPDLLHLWCDFIRTNDRHAAFDLVGVLHQTEQQHG